MPRILVTGANGFVGRSLVPRLRTLGISVTCAVRSTRGNDEIAVGDIAEFASWPSVLAGTDVVVHLAARAHVLRETASEPLAEFRRVNVCATARLARAAVATGVRRFVFLSSIGVNGIPTTVGAFSESDPPNPSEPYAVSKWEAERALLELAAGTGMQITRVRPPLIVGAGVKGNLHRLLKLVDSGIPLPLGAIRNRRSFIALDDLCALLASCVVHPRAGNELFLAANLKELSTPELLRAMAEGLGRTLRLVPIPAPMLQLGAGVCGFGSEIRRMISSLRIDATRARTVLGWNEVVGLDQSIRTMTAHYLRERRA